jgi:hypothetical protein
MFLFRFCFRLVWPVLPVSLDCSFVITLSIFSNVYSNINMLHHIVAVSLIVGLE